VGVVAQPAAARTLPTRRKCRRGRLDERSVALVGEVLLRRGRAKAGSKRGPRVGEKPTGERATEFSRANDDARRMVPTG
jgi:hypothetical protein